MPDSLTVWRLLYNSQTEISFDIQVGVGDAPQGVWMENQIYNIHDYFPNATAIKKIELASNGWSFTGMVDNIEVIPEPSSLALLSLVGGVGWVVRRKYRT